MHSRALSLDRDVWEFRRLFLLFAAEQERIKDKIEINAIIQNIQKIALPRDILVHYMKTLVQLSVHRENVSAMVIRPWSYSAFGYFWLTATRMYGRADNGFLCCMIWTLIRNISRFEEMRDTL